MVGGFPSAVDDTVSAGKAGKAGKFPEACFGAQAWCLSIMDPPGIGHAIKKMCAGAVVREGYDAPVQAPARPAQLSPKKHTYVSDHFSSRIGAGASSLCAGAVVPELGAERDTY